MINTMRFATVAGLALIPTVLAQTYTSCNPLNQTNCAANVALGTSATFNWTTSAADNQVWNTTLGKINFAPQGGLFTVARKNDAPTIQSLFSIFWGRVSVIMKAANGQGIVSSVVLQSDDLDEIDWEWIGGNTTHVQTNFFGKGDTTSYDRAIWHEVDGTLDEHNYTVVWTQDQIQWYVDNRVLRTLKYADPVAQSKNNSASQPGDRYPQTPMNIRIGNWAGGDPTLNGKGTVDWAGGVVDYSKGPYVQTVVSVEAEDYTQGSTYTYGDKTGSWKSIKVATGNSTIADRISKPHPSVNQQFNALSKGAKIAIGVAAISVVSFLFLLLAFCCIKHRRAGRKEKAVADAEWERNLNELQQYKRMMVSEEEIHPRAGYI